MNSTKRTSGQSRLRAFLRHNTGQVIVSILVALLLGGATFTANQAAGKWQSATREEVKWSTAALETLRFVYTDEAPEAYSIASSQNRADVLEKFTYPGDTGPIEAEAATARETAAQEIFGLKGSNALIAEKYLLPGGGYDIARRLGDERKADPLSINSATDDMAEGDRLNAIAQAQALACVPIVLIWVAGQAAVNVVRRRRRSISLQPQADDVGIVPQPWIAKPHRKKLTSAALTAWILLTLMPVAGLAVSTAGQRSDAESSRRAVRLSTDLLASSAQATRVAQQLVIKNDLFIAALRGNCSPIPPRRSSGKPRRRFPAGGRGSDWSWGEYPPR